ncbi:MAG: PGF-pre-PGF domain-containing protein, partial [Methanohalobium sp.]|uniref:PGF-pre-PGF domain-containing protein n=1 Tax=Methanohalobium sp. TaxID=2837493 RepID=UPI00397B60FE
GDSLIQESYSDCKVTGNESIGGLVGANGGKDLKVYDIGGEPDKFNTSGGLINSSNASGTVQVNNDYPGMNIGGLVGQSYDGTVEKSNATGDVIAGGSDNVGGLVGYNDGDSVTFEPVSNTVLESYATGAVEGNQSVGGLIGTNFNDTVQDTYALGSVDGNTDIGGLVGNNTGEKGYVNHSYAAGPVSGSDNVSGLIGWNNEGSVTSAYWDTETTGQDSSDGGTPLTTSEMKGDESKTKMKFDFGNTWNVVDISNSISYPYLSNNTQQPEPGLESLDSEDKQEPETDDDSVRLSVGDNMPDESVRSTDSKQKVVSAGESVEYNFSESSGSVKGISFDSKENMGRVIAKVQTLDKLPDDVKSPTETGEKDQTASKTYSTMSITVGKSGTVSESNSDNTLIEFDVTKEWVEDNNIDPETIRMERYHNGEWHDLTTNKVAEDDNLLHFTAFTPGFSIFAVVGDEIEETGTEEEENETATDETVEPEPDESTPGFTSLLILGVIGTVYMVLRRKN